MATKTMHFTKKALESIEPPAKGRDTYRDDMSRRLHLRVTAKGQKTYTLIQKVQGRVRYIALGEFPTTTVSQARRECDRQSAMLAKGDEPAQPKPHAMTFADLFAQYLEEHAKPHKRSWKDDETRFQLYLSRWRNKRLNDIRRADVRSLHNRLKETKGNHTANRVLALVKKMYNFAIYDQDLPLERNPADRITMHTEESRERYLKPEELGDFWRALEHEDTPQDWEHYFKLALVTGARRSNLSAMKWADLDLAAEEWTIAGDESKNGKPLHVALSPEALAILRDRQEQWGDSPFVFPSKTSRSGHLQEPKSAWKRILERAGIEDLRIHDLRRTLGSWQAANGASLSIIGHSLGHKDSKTTEIYARLDLKPVKESVNAATAKMMKAVNGLPKDEK